MKTIAKILGVIALCALLAVGGQFFGLWNLKFFGPKFQDAHREIYENTQSYTEGKAQALTKYYREFCNAAPGEKLGIRNLMMQDLSRFDVNKLTPVQKEWYDEMVHYMPLK